MKKMLMGILVALALAGCGQQQAESATTPPPPAPEVTAEQAKAVLCGQPMDITAEQLLGNLDKSLRAIGASPAIRDQNLTANDCGYLLEMTMDFGTIRLELDEAQKVRNLGAGYQNIIGSDGVMKNMNNAFASVQTAMSVNGTAKFGESEFGQSLFKTIGDLIIEHKNVGSGTQDIDFEGNRYTVGVDGKTVAIVVRKIP